MRLYVNGKEVGLVEFVQSSEELWVVWAAEGNSCCRGSQKEACRCLAELAGTQLLEGHLRPSIRRRTGYDVILPKKKAQVRGWVRSIEEGATKLFILSELED
jgi:hypothetical protein